MDPLSSGMLHYVECNDIGEPSGRSVTFEGVEFLPLGYDDLLGKKLDQAITIPLRWNHARAIKSSIPEIAVPKTFSGRAILESRYTTKTIGLVKGGWLPAGLDFREDTIYLPDRCTISELKGHFHNGARKADRGDFMDLFEGRRIRINPLLSALEGNVRANPSSEVIERSFEEACIKIKAALPMAELVPENAGGFRGVVGIAHDTHARMSLEQDFLLHLAPKLHAPVGKKRKIRCWHEILTLADSLGISRVSLVVVAALSATSVPHGKSPAKRVLKLTEHYSTEDAYNALADLRALEILMCLFALFPQQPLMLCTSDKNLALLWAGIRASDFVWSGNSLKVRLSPVEGLFPDVSLDELSAFWGSDQVSLEDRD